MNVLSSLFNPYIVSGVSGLTLSFALILLLVKSRMAIVSCVAFLKNKLSSKIAFFWFVIVIFMIVSVIESGKFFNIIDDGALWGTLGYAIAFVIDLVAIASMQARLEASRMREKNGKRLYLVCVLVCASLSAFANTATSLHGYDRNSLHGAPAWMIETTPWLGMAFPLLILIMSITADYIVDRTNDSLDAEAYRKHEQKRVDILSVKKDIEEKLLRLDQEIAELAQSRRTIQKGGKVQNSWWPFGSKQNIDVQQIIQDTVSDVKAIYDPQILAMRQYIETQFEDTVVPIEGEIAHLSLLQIVRNDMQKAVRRLDEIEAQISDLRTDFDVRIQCSIEQVQSQILCSIEQFQDTKQSVVSLEKMVFEMQEVEHRNLFESSIRDTDKTPVIRTKITKPLSVRSNDVSNNSSNAVKSRRKRPQVRSKITKKIPIPAYDLVFEELNKDCNLTVTDIHVRTGIPKSTISPLRTKILDELSVRSNDVSNNSSNDFADVRTGTIEQELMEEVEQN